MREEMRGFNHAIVSAIKELRADPEIRNSDWRLGLIGAHKIVSLWHHAIVIFGQAILDAWAVALASPAPRGKASIVDLLQTLGRSLHNGVDDSELMKQTLEIWRRACLAGGEYGVIHVWGQRLLKYERNRSGLCATSTCPAEVSAMRAGEIICAECDAVLQAHVDELEHSCDDLTPDEQEMIEEEVEEMYEEREAEEEAIERDLKGKKCD